MNTLKLYSSVVGELFEQSTCGSECARYFSISAELVLCVRFADAYLMPPICKAIEHLEVSPREPALTVCVWDSSRGRTPAPYPLWANKANHPLGYYSEADGVRIACELWPHRLTLLDASERKGIYWVKDINELPLYEQCCPLRTILHWFLLQGSARIVHSAAVGTDLGGALLVGKSGSGKSTTALNCLFSGMHHISDDYCLLDRSGEDTLACGLYNAAKFTPGVLKLPDQYQSAQVGRIQEKTALFLSERYRNGYARRLPLKVVLVPTVTGQPLTTIHPASHHEVWRALLPSSMEQIIGGPFLDDFFGIMSLTKRIPAYHLQLGADHNAIPGIISMLIARHSQATCVTGATTPPMAGVINEGMTDYVSNIS